MTTTRPRTAVPMPEISPDAFMAIGGDALEAMEIWIEALAGPSAFHWQVAFERIAMMDRKLLGLILDRSLVGATAAEVFDAMTLNDIAERALDALTITLYGKPYAEHLAALDAASGRRSGDA